jgi:hypothetical protein
MWAGPSPQGRRSTSSYLERRPSTLGLHHARVCIANGKTPRASPSPFKPTATAGRVTIHFRSRSKKHVKKDLRLCSPPWTTRAP